MLNKIKVLNNVNFNATYENVLYFSTREEYVNWLNENLTGIELEKPRIMDTYLTGAFKTDIDIRTNYILVDDGEDSFTAFITHRQRDQQGVWTYYIERDVFMGVFNIGDVIKEVKGVLVKRAHVSRFDRTGVPLLSRTDSKNKPEEIYKSFNSRIPIDIRTERKYSSISNQGDLRPEILHKLKKVKWTYLYSTLNELQNGFKLNSSVKPYFVFIYSTDVDFYDTLGEEILQNNYIDDYASPYVFERHMVDLFPETEEPIFEVDMDETTGRIKLTLLVDDYQDKYIKLNIIDGKINISALSQVDESDDIITEESVYIDNIMPKVPLTDEYNFKNEVKLYMEPILKFVINPFGANTKDKHLYINDFVGYDEWNTVLKFTINYIKIPDTYIVDILLKTEGKYGGKWETDKENGMFFRSESGYALTPITDQQRQYWAEHQSSKTGKLLIDITKIMLGVGLSVYGAKHGKPAVAITGAMEAGRSFLNLESELVGRADIANLPNLTGSSTALDRDLTLGSTTFHMSAHTFNENDLKVIAMFHHTLGYSIMEIRNLDEFIENREKFNFIQTSDIIDRLPKEIPLPIKRIIAGALDSGVRYWTDKNIGDYSKDNGERDRLWEYETEKK